MLWTVDVCIINLKSVYTWHSSLFNCNANIAFMVLNFKHKFIPNLNLDGLIENNCSLLPVWALIRCIQTMLFIQMKMIPERNCSDLARLANLYLKKILNITQLHQFQTISIHFRDICRSMSSVLKFSAKVSNKWEVLQNGGWVHFYIYTHSCTHTHNSPLLLCWSCSTKDSWDLALIVPLVYSKVYMVT